MAIVQSDLVITGNGRTNAIWLSPRQNRVTIYYPPGVTGDLEVVSGVVESELIPHFILNNQEGAVAQATASIIGFIEGPGLLAFDVTLLSGGNIKVNVAETF